MDAIPRLLLLLPGEDARELASAWKGVALCQHVDREGFCSALDADDWSAVVCDEVSARTLLGTPALPPLIVLVEQMTSEALQELLAAGVFAVLYRERADYLATLLERLPGADRRRNVDRQQGFLRELYDNIGEVFWLIDTLQNRLLYLSPAFESIWERSPDAPLASLDALLDTIHAEDVERVQLQLESEGWAGLNLDYRIFLPDGECRWIATRSFPIRDADRRITRVAGVSRDITEAKRLELQGRTLNRAVEQTADAVMITDTQGLIVYVNPAFEEITGYTSDEVLGQNPSLLKSGLQDKEFYRHVWRSLLGGVPYSDIFINRRKDGDLYYESKTITPVRDERGEITHFVATGKDITARLKAQQRLRDIIHYDAVTGLANHILLEERLERAIHQARRLGGVVGVFHIDLDLGGLLGRGRQEVDERERMLRLVARRLQTSVGEGETVARLEEEHFVILHKHAEGLADLEQVVHSLMEAFSEPLSDGGYELYLSPNIGISCYPLDSEEGSELLACARTANEALRRQGGERYRFYHTGEGAPRGRLTS